MNGKVDLVMVDLKELDKGKCKELKRATHTGEPGKTINFRKYFSTDDKVIFQAVGDRFWLLDANTLEKVDEKMSTAGENHDAMPTPDGKFALLTIRNGKTDACDAEGKPRCLPIARAPGAVSGGASSFPSVSSAPSR